MSNREHVVATIPKGRRNIIRVTLSKRGCHPIIDIRQHEPNGLQVLVPTMKGVKIDLAAVPMLIAALETIRSEARQ